MFEATPEKQIKQRTKDLDPEERKEILDGLKELKSSHGKAGWAARAGDLGMIDGIIGAIPVIGDPLAATIGLYIIAQAKKLGVPTRDILKMVNNSVKDLGIGAIPVVGDVLDLFYVSNLKNFKILDKYFKDPKNTDRILATIKERADAKKSGEKKGVKTNLVEFKSSVDIAALKKAKKIDKQAA